MKRILKTGVIFILSILSAAAFLLEGCSSKSVDNTQETPLQSIDTAMGTIIQQTIYRRPAAELSGRGDPAGQPEEKPQGQEAADQGTTGQIQTNSGSTETENIPEAVLRQITDLEQELLSWRLDTSEVFAINESVRREEGIPLSDKMVEILTQCLEVSERSEGAFDITLGEIVRLWNIDSWAGAEETGGYVPPRTEEIMELLSETGYENVNIQGNTLYLPADMQLDLGAVGKGIALTKVGAYLKEQRDIAGAVISVGGSIMTYGAKPDGTPWRVAVVNPHDTSLSIGYLELKGDYCVSTSGNYERYVEVDGVRYHHILDPSTGYPAESGLDSVTILTQDGLLSDALSTACFVLGKEKGSRLAASFGAEALFVDHSGKISMTEGMEQYFHLSN